MNFQSLTSKPTFSFFSKSLLFSLFLLCFCAEAQGQGEQVVDSLKKVLATTTDPLQKIEVCIELSRNYRNNNPPLSISYAKKGIKEANQQKKVEEELELGCTVATAYMVMSRWDSAAYWANLYQEKAELADSPKFIAWALNIKGSRESNKGNLDEAIKLYERGMELSKLVPDSLNGIQMFATNLGNKYMEKFQYEKAIDYFNLALNCSEKVDAPIARSILLRNIGMVNNKLGNHETALKYFLRAKAVRESIDDKRGVLFSSFQIIEFHSEKKEPKAMLQEAQSAYKIAEELNDPYFIGIMSGFMAKAFDANGDEKEAKKYINQLGDLVKKHDFKGELLNDYFLIKALIETESGSAAQAVLFANKAMELAKADKRQSQAIEAEQVLAEAYKKQGNATKALEHFTNYYAARDSLATAERVQRLGAIEANLTNAENEAEIALLEKDKIAKESQIFKTQMVTGGIALLGLLGFAFFYNARRKNRLISAQKETLEQQKTALESLNTTKDRLFSIIGHDLRKPALSFRGITKKINYLLHHKDYPALEKIGDDLEKDAHALSNLTDNLLNWALTQKDMMPYKPEEIELADLTDSVLSVFRKMAADKGISITSDIDDEIKVFADVNALRTVLRNLVDNAIKYTNEGGSIEIGAKTGEKEVQFYVSDNGIGMTAAEQQELFLLKKDKSQVGTGGEQGTGLGLHLVHELLAMNKGVIDVESEQGAGTRFEVLLPIGNKAAA